ncbi:family 43 glycosylhydrolase [Occallatibacter riparius]|uniref:Family 43 glycosylhydrolase n=1 Tax=Occallatibacter riparius TaxID=1002689 RepID=A0A9J7BXG1_9BACT|nr:family 43 glycosylhydrolase [Occallatibacter riparius]UWZ85845.1 family 43 glycosylhydrolase [Occallatibacter riparius]
MGASVTLTAQVMSGGTAVGSGSVSFADGTTQLGKATLGADGKGAWSGTFRAGTHMLTASFGGTPVYAPSASTAASLSVTQPTAPSSIALVLSSAHLGQGLPLEIIATVTGGGSTTPAPTGTVTYTSGSISLGTATLDPTGVANFTSTLLPPGQNQITATYSGDSVYASSASAAAVVNIEPPASTAYKNPLTLNVTGSLTAVSCADPAILKVQNAGADTWHLYCTSDALYAGDPKTHLVNLFHSTDLVNWSYDGDAFAALPSWANVKSSSYWAPAVRFLNGKYYLYFAVPATGLSGGGSAIGVGTSSNPAGPFVDAGAPVVEPEPATNCCGGVYRTTIDPDVIEDAAGQKYILFGGFMGGLYVRKLSADGLTSDKASEVEVAVDNRYEGGNWVLHDGYYYLFASSTNCCNGPLTGYGVFVGRSKSPMGPYVDAQGIAMSAVNPGGTPVLTMNGNTVVGPGGNVIFSDETGQDYILYHGILSASPYYAGSVSYNARPAFLEAIDWINGWPVARGGFGPSDDAAPQPMPAAQPGQTNAYASSPAKQDLPRAQLTAASDDFSVSTLSAQWSFVHGTPNYAISANGYQVSSVAADPVANMPGVPMACEAAPTGDYMTETKLDFDLPAAGKGPDFAQAGLLIYGDDANFLRADIYNNNDTRQVEFINAETAEHPGYPTWGGSNLGSVAIGAQVTAWLRIVKRNVNGESHYTGYSSADGATWIQGATWVHSLGAAEKLCMYAGNQTGHTGTFHYVHVSTVE